MRFSHSQKRGKSGQNNPTKRPAGRDIRSNKEGSAKTNVVPPELKGARIVIGNHAIAECIKVNGKSIKAVWVRQGWEDSAELRELSESLNKFKVRLQVVPPGQLDRFGGHQGMAVFASGEPELNWEKLKTLEKGIVLFLDGIEDPHNLGAILRTAWLMGVQAVFLPKDRSVGLTPSAHKVACGGVEHVPVVVVSSFANSIEELKELGFWAFGLSHKAEREVFELKLGEKVIWMVGAEDKGLRTTSERLCDELARIPQVSAAASYNASVATAIALTETFRQQKK